MDCPTPTETTHDGCCVDWCAITRNDVRCLVRALLPPGEMWRRDRQNSMLLEFIDILADQIFGVMQDICRMIRESDPCTAVETIDRWAEVYGIPPAICDLITGCSDSSALDALKEKLVCLMAKLEYGQVPDCCFFKEIGDIFGVDVCCALPVHVNDPHASPGCDTCDNGIQKWPAVTFPSSLLESTPGCPPVESSPCCEPEPLPYARANCTRTCENMCETPQTPDSLPPDGFPPVVVFFLRPPPSSAILARANCSVAGDARCVNPLVRATECMIRLTLPYGVHACIIERSS